MGIFAHITQRDKSHQVTTAAAAATTTTTTTTTTSTTTTTTTITTTTTMTSTRIDVTFSADASSTQHLIKMQYTNDGKHDVFSMERTLKRRMFAAET